MAARKKAVDETQDVIGDEPGEEEAIASTEEESSDPDREVSEDSETEKPFRTREERAEHFSDLKDLKEQNEFLSDRLEQALSVLGTQKAEPERNGDTEPTDEELDRLAREKPWEAIKLASERVNKGLFEAHRAREEQQSVVAKAKDRLLSRWDEFNDPSDPFSKEVDRVYQRMSNEQGYAPQENSTEWSQQLRAAALEVELEKPNLRKKNRPSAREKLRDRTQKETTMSSMPTSRSSSRPSETDLPEWTAEDEVYAKKCGLADKDGKVPERIKTGILRSRGSVGINRHPNLTRDEDLKP